MTALKWRLLAAVLCATPLSAVAADDSGNYAIWGNGGRSCHQYLRSAADASERAGFRNYLMGYLTAYNALVDDTYNALGEVNLEDALKWLEAYCGTHQIDSYDRAITLMVVAHHSDRHRAPGGHHAPSWGRAAGSGAGSGDVGSTDAGIKNN